MTARPRTRPIAIAGTAFSTAVIAAAYLAALVLPTPPGWAAWAVALGVAGLFSFLLALGAAHPRLALGGLRVVFGLVFLLLATGFGIVLAWAPPMGPDQPLWLGLPPWAAVVLYGIGVFPLVLLPLAYALTFDDRTLSAEDLERIRAARKREPS